MKRPADDSHDATKRPKTLNHVFHSHQTRKRTFSDDDTPISSLKRPRSDQPKEQLSANQDTSHFDEAASIAGDETEPINDVSNCPTRTTTHATPDIDAQSKISSSETSDGYLPDLNDRSFAIDEDSKNEMKSTSSGRKNRRVMFATATTYLFEWEGCNEPTLARRHVREKTKILKCVTFSTATTYMFERDLGGSAVMNGPALGLASTHCEECTVDISKTDDKPKGKPVGVVFYRRYSLLKRAGVTFDEIAEYCKESCAILESRDATKREIRRQERMDAYYQAQQKVIALNRRFRDREEDI